MTCMKQMLCKHGMGCPIANGYDITRCTGFKPQEQTNEEFPRSCSTEELAGFIADVCYELQDDIWTNSEDTSCDYYQTDKTYWVEWLKEKHE